MNLGRVGIIPAAGRATRWGGYLKELLPMSDKMAVIDCSIDAMVLAEVDAIVVVTNVTKLPEISKYLEKFRMCPIFYKMQCGVHDFWSAIEEAMLVPADEYLFAMPDTIFPIETFRTRPEESNFSLGTHWTNRPERFGMLRDGQIIDKQPGEPGRAWGLLSWSYKVRDTWLASDIINYTHAINMAIGEFGLHTWDIKSYWDMASFEDYREWLG